MPSSDGSGPAGSGPRKHRLAVEISPAFIHTFQTRSLSRNAVALWIGVVPTRRLAVGLYGAYFSPFDGERPSTDRGPLLSQISGAITADAKVTILGGHEDGRGGEMYVLGGIGVVVSRPISIVDPEHRHFEPRGRVAVTHGAGARYFFVSGMAAFVELRVTNYLEREESRRVDSTEPGDRDKWFGPGRLSLDLGAHVGLTFEVPGR